MRASFSRILLERLENLSKDRLCACAAGHATATDSSPWCALDKRHQSPPCTANPAAQSPLRKTAHRQLAAQSPLRKTAHGQLAAQLLMSRTAHAQLHRPVAAQQNCARPTPPPSRPSAELWTPPWPPSCRSAELRTRISAALEGNGAEIQEETPPRRRSPIKPFGQACLRWQYAKRAKRLSHSLSTSHAS